MFSEIKIGFLRGVGFAVAMLIAWGIVYLMIMSTFDDWDSDYDEADYVEFSDETKLVPNVLSYEVHQNRATVLGVIENQTDHSWDSTLVEVEFYQGETFVRECNQEIPSTIKSRTKENFELSCKSCGDTFPKFDRIELKINGSQKQY